MPRPLGALFLALSLFAMGVQAQTTAFTFQGKLNDNGVAANGAYDMQLKLYDVAAVGSGTQIGNTVTLSSIPVIQGVFTVQPDFTANAFPGADRFVEVGVKPAGSANPFTILSPRQPITPTPYALHSLNSVTANSATNATNATTATNSTQLGGVAATNYVQTNDAHLTDARVPLPGSTNYIQNSTTQESANFNISGNGFVGGKVGIGTTTPQSNLEVRAAPFSYGITQTDGTVRLSTYTDGGYGWIGTPTNHPLLFYTNSTFGMSLDTSGRFGIGTVTPQARLHVNGTSWFQGDTTPLPNTAGKGIAVGFGGETGYLFAFDYTAFAPKNLLLNSPGGNVGIGTVAPAHLLDLAGGPTWTSSGWVGSLAMNNGAALGWRADAGGQRFGLGQSGGGLYFFRTASDPGTTASPPTYDMAITDAGNIGIGTTTPTSKLEIAAQDGLKITGFQPFLTLRDTNSANKSSNIQSANGNLFVHSDAGNVIQPRNNNGLMKAMALIKDDGTVATCYNSQAAGAAVNTSPCGIAVTFEAAGDYLVDFGFAVTDRFISVTPRTFTSNTSAPIDVTATVGGASNVNQTKVFLRSSDGARSGFYIFVY